MYDEIAQSIEQVHIDVTTGEIYLCMAFYDYMRYKRRNIKYFADAIRWLEAVSDDTPIVDFHDAIDYIQRAVRFSYAGGKL